MKFSLNIFTAFSFLGLSFLSLADNNNETKQRLEDEITGGICRTNLGDKDIPTLCLNPANVVKFPTLYNKS